MDDPLARIWSDLVGRLTGPMNFRLILQPAMATLYSLKDELRDAREGRLAYFWQTLTHPESRRRLLTDAWKVLGHVIILAIVVDVAY
jgi:hypothetical protein